MNFSESFLEYLSTVISFLDEILSSKSAIILSPGLIPARSAGPPLTRLSTVLLILGDKGIISPASNNFEPKFSGILITSIFSACVFDFNFFRIS